MAGETRLYLDDYFESDTGYTTWVRYYYFGGQRVAQRTSLGVTYLHADHLGSTSGTTGITTSQQLYLPYGDQRTVEEVAAEYRYTGQRREESIGLYDYKARYYDPALGRFIQPDTIVPEPGNPQSLNRYSYGYNNPVKYTDPSGHVVDEGGVQYYVPHDLLYIIALIRYGDASAKTAMESVLAETMGVGNSKFLHTWDVGTRTHFYGLGAVPGALDFAAELQDEYLYQTIWGGDGSPESRQLGHFLTAVDMGLHGDWLRAITGHERAGDPALFSQLARGDKAAQDLFVSAAQLDAEGKFAERDEKLAQILNEEGYGPIEGRRGNSMEDLRLSVRGWRLGNMIESGELKTSRDVANWIALNVVQH